MSKNNFEIITLNKPGISDFSAERNKLLNKAKSEWVFFLDTDEKMSPFLKKEILHTIETTNCNGFYIYRKNYFLGRLSGMDNILRLGKKNSGIWSRSVHEKWNIKGKTGQLKNPIIHNTAKSVSEMVAKINFYSTLHADANKNEGKNASVFKIIFYPKIKFIQSMLMGRGTVFSIMQSFHSFLAWSKQWEKQN